MIFAAIRGISRRSSIMHIESSFRPTRMTNALQAQISCNTGNGEEVQALNSRCFRVGRMSNEFCVRKLGIRYHQWSIVISQSRRMAAAPSTPFFVHVSTFRRKYCWLAQYPPAATGAGKKTKRSTVWTSTIRVSQSKPVGFKKGRKEGKRYVKVWKWERGRSRSTGLLRVLLSSGEWTSESNNHRWYDRPYIQTVRLSRLGDRSESYDTLWILLSFSTSIYIQFFQALLETKSLSCRYPRTSSNKSFTRYTCIVRIGSINNGFLPRATARVRTI